MSSNLSYTAHVIALARYNLPLLSRQCIFQPFPPCQLDEVHPHQDHHHLDHHPVNVKIKKPFENRHLLF